MSLRKTLLISEKALKDNSLLQSNVDMSMIRPTILLVQDMKLQKILGTALYRDIQKEVFNDNISPEYKTLLDDFIEQIIIYGVMSESSYDLTFKFTNLSMVRNNGENGEESLPFKELNYISKKNKDRMEFYLKRLDDFLCHNQSDYPKFTDNEEDDIRPTRKSYNTGIFTGQRHKYKDKLPAPYRYQGEL